MMVTNLLCDIADTGSLIALASSKSLIIELLTMNVLQYLLLPKEKFDLQMLAVGRF